MSDVEPTPAIDPRLSGRDRVLAQIEIWRNELVNLARSNRLLHYRDTKASTLGIVAEESEVAGIVDRLLNGGTWTFFLPPDQEEGEDNEPISSELLPGPGELLTDRSDRAALVRTLRNLDRRATQEYMDKGLWILYLAAGHAAVDRPRHEGETSSPLLLVPVSLHRENPRAPYRLSRGRRGHGGEPGARG